MSKVEEICGEPKKGIFKMEQANKLDHVDMESCRNRLRSLYRAVNVKRPEAQAAPLIRDIVENTEAFIRRVQGYDSVLNNTIEAYPDMDALKPFAVSCYWTGLKIVNIFEVVGTTDKDYIGVTWITMLRLGQQMSINLPLLREKPGYYFNVTDRKLPEMNFTRINSKLYISGEGNHRTAIAKVLFAFLGLQNFGAVRYEGISGGRGSPQPLQRGWLNSGPKGYPDPARNKKL